MQLLIRRNNQAFHRVILEAPVVFNPVCNIFRDFMCVCAGGKEFANTQIVQRLHIIVWNYATAG